MTYDMCMGIGAALETWKTDPDIAIVVIDAEGSRSFCSGGDIADLYKTGLEGNYDYGRKFWADEYRINEKIKNYPKPYVAIMDGIVMGGGVGISAHGSHRIVTENTMFAMPECGIGLVPDVGGNFLLSRAEGSIGEYLAATAARLNASDCIYAGIADSFVPEDDLPELIKSLETNSDVSIINEFARECVPGDLALNQKTINTHFSKANAVDIIASLEADNGRMGNHGRKTYASQLSALSHEVLGYDTSPDVLENAKEARIITCATAVDAASEAETLITMLPNGEILLSCHGRSNSCNAKRCTLD
ncbi:3-hydroxyisobutyryl-CoA hydrolase, mitochondrial [Nymphon striatum]|nr:3-hydroxyisobutyryl-CoA hydrolase, mitochondrial [Nymphon striatum]